MEGCNLLIKNKSNAVANAFKLPQKLREYHYLVFSYFFTF
jgi:hypothetical protein